MKANLLRFVVVPLLLPLLLLILILSPVTPGNASPNESPTGGVSPTILVPDGVARSTVQNAKVWWWYTLACFPTMATEQAQEPTGTDFRVEEIARIATTGGLTRTVFVHDVLSPYCGDWVPKLLSNVDADDDYLYWMNNDPDGLVKLSVEANAGDEPALLYDDQTNADEIVERGDYVYLMNDTYGIIRVSKSNGAATTVVSSAALGGASRDLQATDEYLFWNQNGFLKVSSNSGGGGDGITTEVTSYIAENSLCPPGEACTRSELVFIGRGEQIQRYNLDTDTFSSVLYDSPINDAVVVDITVDSSNIYFFEMRPAGCDMFCSYDYGLYRMNRSGGTAELIYSLTGQGSSLLEFDLTLGGPGDDYLFWHDQGQLKRLARDAAAIPSVDVFITDIEVTQAIQDLDNSVELIRDKRTGVRVHIDAAGQNVPGIAARLYRINSVGTVIDGPIYPSGGTNYLTVPNNPDRATFDHAFYFELPNEWISGTSLRLRAEVNPNQIPPEPSFSNNMLNTANFTLRASPTLRTHLLVWGYTVDDTYYQPNNYQDVFQARSWIRRVYPLASTPGGYESPDPGFRLKTRIINDPNLGEHVQQTSDFCQDMPVKDREFCAATYTNNCALWLRATEGIPDEELIYSMIWDDPSLPFPRGFATGGVSAGPTGTDTFGWDTDGSYGDWYMGHEIGHNVGRAHPAQGTWCGQSASDPDFPYEGAAIGTGDMWGFDVGELGLNSALNPRVYPNSQWRDMMSYCDRQWISDYTYEGIYDYLMTTQTVQAASKPDRQPVRAGTTFIALFGTIYDSSDQANFQVVGLWDSPGPYISPDGGAYRMRFLDSNGSQLASYDFDGDANDASPTNYGFAVVVPFPVETAEVQLIRISDGMVLGEHTLSANPPTISNVELVGAPSFVTGTVTLQWQASDPDGDPLHFDVYYTDDNGATYTAYALALSTNSVQLDTNQMGGGAQARFRVTANDGARMAEAESATFRMASKPPIVTILTPQDGLEVVYGTPVNFVAEVEDLQGHVPDTDITWFVNGEDTGVNGPYYTAYLLPVGVNEVSVEATNVNGQATTKTVTVIVNDDLAYPGPNLAVGPDQVSWQVVEGTSTLQQATLNISNIGTGSLSWTASEDANWLSLSTTEGDTPGTLTLTANPSAVPSNVPMSTMLTISGDNGQTVQLPVSLLVGVNPIWGHNPDRWYEVDLPMIWR